MMTQIDRHPLLEQAYEVCLAIEECGASVELTNAVTKASALLAALDKFIPVVADHASDCSTAHRRPDPSKGAPKPAGHNPVA